MNRIAVAKTALEPAPAQAFGVEQIADVFARITEGYLCGTQRIADVAERARIADDRAASGVAIGVAAGDRHGLRAAGPGRLIDPWNRTEARLSDAGNPVSVAGNEIDGARCRRAVSSAEGIVAHREMLGVVPQGSDGIPVEIAHHGRL